MTVPIEGGRWQRLQPRERALVVIVGVIALLAVAYLLLAGGDDEPEGFPTAPSATQPTVPRAPTASPTPTAAPETNEIFEGKDPFRPLVAEGGVGGTPAPEGSPGPSGGPTDEGGQRVTLVEINGSGNNRVAVVQVDGKEHTVGEGDTFAGSYRVKNLTADCGTFVFGDEQFTLCVGQEVLK